MVAVPGWLTMAPVSMYRSVVTLVPDFRCCCSVAMIHLAGVVIQRRWPFLFLYLCLSFSLYSLFGVFAQVGFAFYFSIFWGWLLMHPGSCLNVQIQCRLCRRLLIFWRYPKEKCSSKTVVRQRSREADEMMKNIPTLYFTFCQ